VASGSARKSWRWDALRRARAAENLERHALDLGNRRSSSCGLLVSSGTAYMLRVTTEQLDALAFESRVDRARAAQLTGDTGAAVDAYDQALRLWRGDPLADIDDLRLHPAVVDLRRRRAAVITEYARIASTAGLYDRALPHLRALAGWEPLNERAHARLMIALAGSGQQAEALRVYTELQERLDDQLGVVPCAELRDAYDRVLRQEVPASAAVGAGRAAYWRPVYQLPAAPADFTGRASESAGIEAALSPCAGRTGVPVAVVSGMPGAGKTALALHVAHTLRPQFPGGQLWMHLAGTAARPREPGEVLADLLHELGVRASSVPQATRMRAALFRSRLAGRKVLLVADDVASGAQIRPLLPGTAGSAMLMTSRALLALPNGETTVILGELTEAEAVRMLARIVGEGRVAADSGAAVRLVRACGLLPLAIRIAGAKLAARQCWPLSVMADRLTQERNPMDELEIGDLSMRSSIGSSYRALGERARRALRMLGGMGAVSCTEPVVATVLGEPDVAGVVSELVGTSLIVPSGVDGSGEPSYLIHPLVRDFAAERLVYEP
jgi:DNA-binding SARP family transcriptional activator